MESLDNELSEQNLETKSTKFVDRVTIGNDEAKKVDSWLRQVNQYSKGFLSLTKSDIVNFLIRSRRGDLTPKELLQIRADHYDPIRHITWITPQIKVALSSGDLIRVKELQDELRGVDLHGVRESVAKSVSDNRYERSTDSRRKKSKTKADSDSNSTVDSKLKSKSMPNNAIFAPDADDISGALLEELPTSGIDFRRS